MKCNYYSNDLCRSCSHLDHSYLETLKLKESHLKLLFSKKNILIPSLKKSIGLDSNVDGSRYKAKFTVYKKNGLIEFGFTKANMSTVEMENCPLHQEGINILLRKIKILLNKYQIEPYDLQTKKGELKFLIITKSNSREEYLIRFVLRSKSMLDRLSALAAELTQHVVTANFQPTHMAVLEGKEEITLSEKKYIENDFDEFKLFLGPGSFFQVTPEIAKQIYNTVSLILSEYKKSLQINSFLDLYCGVGAFSFYASRVCARVLGIEISKSAIEFAEISKAANRCSNLEFHATDVETYLIQQDETFDAVLVNPPRRGLNKEIIECILKTNPSVLIYSSCHAETMLEDFLILKNKYSIESMQIFDMFPFTSHFETLMCLKRNG